MCGVPESRVFCLFLVGSRGFAAAVVCQSRCSLKLQLIFEFQRNGGIVMIFFLQVLPLLLMDILHGYQRTLFYILKINSLFIFIIAPDLYRFVFFLPDVIEHFCNHSQGAMTWLPFLMVFIVYLNSKCLPS